MNKTGTYIYIDGKLTKISHKANVAKSLDDRVTRASNLEADCVDLRGYQSMYKRGEWKGKYNPSQIKEIYKDALKSGKI